jgi:hypothetical protein
MERIYKIDNIAQYNADNNTKTLNPLVSVIDFSRAD